MPNRILKETICVSEKIERLSWFEEALFYRLIVNCDDYGRADGRATVLRSRLFPLKSDVTVEQIEQAVERLCEIGSVQRYEVDGEKYLLLTGWDRHQRVRSKRSKYPEPVDGGVQADAADNSRQVAADCGELRQVAASCGRLRRVAADCCRNPIRIRIRIRI